MRNHRHRLAASLAAALFLTVVTVAPAAADPYPDELPDPICVEVGVPMPLGPVVVTYCEPWD